APVPRGWQDAGIAIDAKDIAETAAPAPISVDRPPLYRAAWYRVLELFGMRRNSQGGFGGVARSDESLVGNLWIHFPFPPDVKKKSAKLVKIVAGDPTPPR